jgi:hypothetical protein
MTDKQINRPVKILYLTASIIIIGGGILRIQHYPRGTLISLIGLMLGTITQIFDRSRARRRTKEMEE